MAKVLCEIVVNAPVNKVFDVYSDVEKADERIEAIKKIEFVSEVRRGIGTRWKETRVMFGKEATEEMEITAWMPNEFYNVEALSCGTHYLSSFRFEKLSVNQTKVIMSFNAKPKTFVAKLMSPLGYLMMGTMKKMMLKDMEALKSAAESA